MQKTYGVFIDSFSVFLIFSFSLCPCRHVSPAIDAALHDGPPSPGTLLHFIGLIEHWINAELEQYTHVLPQSTGLAWLHGARRGAGLGSTTSSGDLEVALVEPPSVCGSERSSRDGRSASSGGSHRRGRVARRSLASSDASGSVKVMDLATLAQRAQRAVAARVENAMAVRIRTVGPGKEA